MSDLEQKAVDIIERLESLTISLAPEALELAEQVVFMTGSLKLIAGVILGIASFICYKVNKYHTSLTIKSDSSVAIIMASLITGVIFFFSSFALLMSSENVMSVLAPRLVLAKHVLGL